MDTRSFLDNLLGGARHLAEQGRGMAERQLNVPAAGPQRDAMLDGMGKGALAAGALAMLLGTGTGRRLAGSAVKLGGIAAVGALAYQAYRNWQGGQDALANPGIPIGQLDGSAAAERSDLLLDAMIAAALADGHVDAGERARIEQQMQRLDLQPALAQRIDDRLLRTPTAAELAARADSLEAAAEIYLVSRIVIDVADDSERRYLWQLTEALALDPTLVAELERQLAEER